MIRGIAMIHAFGIRDASLQFKYYLRFKIILNEATVVYHFLFGGYAGSVSPERRSLLLLFHS